MTRHQFLASSTQHLAHGFIGGVLTSGDLAQRLPLGDTLQDDGPFGTGNLEEGDWGIDMFQFCGEEIAHAA